jgi:hypothetical protein
MKLMTACALLCLCLPASLPAQTRPPFSSCAWWQSLRADRANELYLLGYAQGLVSGTVAYPLPDAPETDRERSMLEVFQKGQVQLLQRSALLEDYINAKCADAKNASVRLYGLSMLAHFEKGGMSGDRIEAALRLFRADIAPKRYAVLDALSGK